MSYTSTSIRPFDRLDRCSQFVRLVRDDLKELLTEPADAENARWIVALVNRLALDFDDERDLKDGDDYLECVLERYPSWQSQVTQLRDQQAELSETLFSIRRRLHREQSASCISAELRETLREWIAASESHEHRETGLAQTAYTLEVGTGD